MILNYYTFIVIPYIKRIFFLHMFLNTPKLSFTLKAAKNKNTPAEVLLLTFYTCHMLQLFASICSGFYGLKSTKK
jgi:hypothetical protein